MPTEDPVQAVAVPPAAAGPDRPLPAPVRRFATWTGPLAVTALIVLFEALGAPARRLLEYARPAIADGQVWRLLTGNFVHLGWYHMALNAMGVLLYPLVCQDGLTARGWAGRLGWLALGTGLGLWFFAPRWDTYVGLSGALHGLFLIGLYDRAREDGDPVVWGFLVFLAGKVGFEVFRHAAVSNEAALGGAVAHESHLAGLGAAGLWLLGRWAWQAFRPSRPRAKLP